MKLIFDTDLGGDIDDAMALYLALTSPEVEILGITSVYLAGEWRRSLIRRILRAFGREDIPVYIGQEQPLAGHWAEPNMTPVKPENEDTDGGLDEVSSENTPASAQAGHQAIPFAEEPDAVTWIIETARQHPDAIILAIGPLTNIALALRLAPWLAQTHRLVLMGGDILSGRPEWNILCDPEAARIVFDSGMDIRMIGLNVTNQCRFSKADVEEMLNNQGSPRAGLFSEMLAEFSRRFDFLPTLHDPLALAALLRPEWLAFEPHRIKVETRGEFTRGTTLDLSFDPISRTQVAVSVKSDEFVTYMKNLLLEA